MPHPPCCSSDGWLVSHEFRVRLLASRSDDHLRLHHLDQRNSTTSTDAIVCAAFDAHELAQQAVYEGPAAIVDDDAADAAAAPHLGRMGELVDQMEALHATTPAGIAARVHTLALHAGHGHYSFSYGDGTAGRLLRQLLRDAAALGGRALA